MKENESRNSSANGHNMSGDTPVVSTVSGKKDPGDTSLDGTVSTVSGKESRDTGDSETGIERDSNVDYVPDSCDSDSDCSTMIPMPVCICN